MYSLHLVYSRTQSISAGKVSALSRREVAGIRHIRVKMTLLSRIRLNGVRDNEVILAHNGPQTRSQSTAKILVCPWYVLLSFSALYLHGITRIYRKLIIYITLKNAVVWRGVLYAHGTAINTIPRCIPWVTIAYDTPRRTKAFTNVICGNLRYIRAILWR